MERGLWKKQMFRRRRLPYLKTAPTATEISDARFNGFVRDLEAYERQLTFERTLDALLDLYWRWKKTGDAGLKLRVVLLAFELRRLNRHFRCELCFEE